MRRRNGESRQLADLTPRADKSLTGKRKQISDFRIGDSQRRGGVLASPRSAVGSLRFIKRLIGNVLDIGQSAPHLLKVPLEGPNLAEQTVNHGFKIFRHGPW